MLQAQALEDGNQPRVGFVFCGPFAAFEFQKGLYGFTGVYRDLQGFIGISRSLGLLGLGLRVWGLGFEAFGFYRGLSELALFGFWVLGLGLLGFTGAI